MNVTVFIFSTGVTLMAPILWAALGEVIIEQSGVLNIGIEGVLLLGAFSSAVTYSYTGSLYFGLCVALGLGVVCGIGLGILYVRLGIDQIIGGIVFNIFALGLTTTLYEKYLGGEATKVFPDLKIPVLGRIPWLGEIFFHHNFLIYGAFLAVPVVFYILHRTWFGLYARAVADHPRAGESTGLNVWRLRYAALIIGCILTAVGGAALASSTTGGFVTGLTAGRGFIALAVVVLAAWNPFGVVLGCLLFGVAQALQFQVQNLGPLSEVPSEFVLMLPYVITILAVVFTRGSRYPAACGIPYKPGASTA